MQLPAFEPESTWTPPVLSELPSWGDAKRVAIDVETKDPLLRKLGPGVRRGASIVGVSFAIEDGPTAYLPIGHEMGGNLDAGAVFSYLRDQAKEFRGDLVGANLQYDLDFLEEAGVALRPRFFRDVQVAEALLDELQDHYSLEAIAARRGMPGKDEGHLRAAASAWGVDPKVGLHVLHSKHVGAYAEQDVRLPLALSRRLERLIDEEDLWRVYDLESRLLPALLAMRRRGVRVDFSRLDEVERWSLEEERLALAKVTSITGVRLTVADTTKATALAPALEAIGITPPRTEKANLPSIKLDYLESLDHDVARQLVLAKKFSKLRGTFCKSIREHAIGDRIHPTFNQVRIEQEGKDGGEGARYGRTSCTMPNLQQQYSPDKDPKEGPYIGKRWRSIFVPDGPLWACDDFSQQEPRWLTHFAALTNCRGAEEARERYRNDPTMDNHQMMADMTGLPRTEAKIILLALCYGMGGAKLCRKLGLPTKEVKSWRLQRMIEVAGDEGQALLDRFHVGAPYVDAIARMAQRKASRRGYIITAGGRRCRFPKRPDGSYEFTHKALNRLIQGSSGDQTKKAIVAAYEEGFGIQLQVHDEIDMSVDSVKRADDLADLMRNCVECTVPAAVDVEVGPSWGEIEKVVS